MKSPFLINNRYLVTPEKNNVTDKFEHRDVRIEQRLLEVLQLLATTPNELVTRDQIVSVVWNDYGGADEGLTQAISFLRKVLNDKDKTIIETIPKKGYILNATVTSTEVSVDVQQEPLFKPGRKSSGKVYVLAIVVLTVVAILLYVFLVRNRDNQSPDVHPTHKSQGPEDLIGNRPDSIQHNSPDVLPDSVHRTP